MTRQQKFQKLIKAWYAANEVTIHNEQTRKVFDRATHELAYFVIQHESVITINTPPKSKR